MKKIEMNEKQLLIRTCQEHVAESMLSFHLQLAACFRGNFEEVMRTHKVAKFHVAESLKIARNIMDIEKQLENK